MLLLFFLHPVLFLFNTFELKGLTGSVSELTQAFLLKISSSRRRLSLSIVENRQFLFSSNITFDFCRNKIPGKQQVRCIGAACTLKVPFHCQNTRCFRELVKELHAPLLLPWCRDSPAPTDTMWLTWTSVSSRNHWNKSLLFWATIK